MGARAKETKEAGRAKTLGKVDPSLHTEAEAKELAAAADEQRLSKFNGGKAS